MFPSRVPLSTAASIGDYNTETTQSAKLRDTLASSRFRLTSVRLDDLKAAKRQDVLLTKAENNTAGSDIRTESTSETCSSLKSQA